MNTSRIGKSEEKKVLPVGSAEEKLTESERREWLQIAAKAAGLNPAAQVAPHARKKPTDHKSHRRRTLASFADTIGLIAIPTGSELPLQRASCAVCREKKLPWASGLPSQQVCPLSRQIAQCSLSAHPTGRRHRPRAINPMVSSKRRESSSAMNL